MDHQSETTYAESNGHATDDVTWPQKVKLVTPKSLKPRISISMQDRFTVIIDHQQESALNESDGPLKIKIVTPKIFKVQSLYGRVKQMVYK